MKKKIIFFASLIGILLITLGANAGSYDDYIVESNYISRIYIRKDGPGNARRYEQARFLRRTNDGAFVYCVEPAVSINDKLLYDSHSTNQSNILGISEESWNRISLIAYYGYQYGNHTEDKWYAITQVMIWREIAPEMDIYFTNTLNGSRVERYLEEMAEIEYLVQIHNIVPDFVENEFTIDEGDSIIISEVNGVFHQYSTMKNGDSITIDRGDGYLNITGIKPGTSTIMFEKKDSKYNLPPILYYHTSSQNVFVNGSFNSVVKEIKVNVNEVIVPPKTYQLKIIKIDEETGETINQKGIRFNLINNENKELFTYETNETGFFITDELLSGTYLLEEIEAPIGYDLSDSILIEIDENSNEIIVLKVTNKKTFVPEELQFEFPKTFIR